MRILYVADSRSIHTQRWLSYFCERNHQIGIVSHHSLPEGYPNILFFPLSLESPLPGTRLLKNVIELRRALAEFKPDILHSHYINEYGWLGALSGFKPFALTAWGSDVYLAPKQSALAARLTPWAIRKADYLTADSHDQLKRMVELSGTAGPMDCITWGVDSNQFNGQGGAEFRASYQLPQDALVILSPRSWLTNSNIPLILEAFALVKEDLPEAVLLLKRMTDTAPEIRIKIESLIEKLELTDRVKIIEEMPASALPSMYASADITVSVCASDGTPVSVLEAMASSSLPIVGKLPSL